MRACELESYRNRRYTDFRRNQSQDLGDTKVGPTAPTRHHRKPLPAPCLQSSIFCHRCPVSAHDDSQYRKRRGCQKRPQPRHRRCRFEPPYRRSRRRKTPAFRCPLPWRSVPAGFASGVEELSTIKEGTAIRPRLPSAYDNLLWDEYSVKSGIQNSKVASIPLRVAASPGMIKPWCPWTGPPTAGGNYGQLRRSEEHTSELHS